MTGFEKSQFISQLIFFVRLDLSNENDIYFDRVVSYPKNAFSAKPPLLGNRMSVFMRFKKLRKATFRKEIAILIFSSNNGVYE